MLNSSSTYEYFVYGKFVGYNLKYSRRRHVYNY
jgi:hypothetical protein